MIAVRRLQVVGAVLGLTALLTCTHVWGEPGRDKSPAAAQSADAKLTPGRADQDFARDLAISRFTDQSLITYEPVKGGARLFALLLKPQLDSAPRPLDILAVITDSAGMAHGPLTTARLTTEALANTLGADDRMAVWTLSTKALDVSHGFKTGAQLQSALQDVAKDYPSGAVDLKKGLADAVEKFDLDPTRQRVVLFFGDGKSLASPMDDNDRAALCDQMVRREVAFFAVPMGLHMDAANLHGLVSGTGGKLVRPMAADKPEDIAKNVAETIKQPIFYPTAFQPPPGATDILPTRLPPLRADAATLVIGKVPAGAATFDYALSGKLSGQDKQIHASEAVPAPEVENYFLVDVAGQWKSAKDRPAMLEADRALASAAMQHEVARDDLLTKAYWALEEDQVDPAFKLFDQVQKLDPHCAEAQAGLDIVAQIRDGKLTKEQLFQEIKQQRKTGGKANAATAKDGRLALADAPVVPPAAPAIPPAAPVVPAPAAPPPAPVGPAPIVPPPAPVAPATGPDILSNAAARQAVADQQAAQLVDDAIRRANERVLSRPADAVQDLKQTLEDIRNNPDLSEAARINLVDRLVQSSQTVDRVGRRVQADQEQAQAIAAVAAAKAVATAQTELVQQQTRERMRQYADLMHLGREEAAYIQAQAISEDLVAQGQPVPPAVTAGYKIGLNGYNLRELNRLKTLRQERWLATLLSVEESAVPFPDEPPISFPDSAYIKKVTKLRFGASGSQFDNWKDFSEYRINVKRYATANFGAPDEVGRALEFQKQLNEKIDYELLIPSTLDKVLDELLTHQADIPWTINDTAFAAANQDKDIIKKTEIDKIDKMKGVTRATVLKRLLARITTDGGKATPTYLIRPDSIEITTTDAAVRDKVVRVYPVADLVTPIGGAVPPGGIFGYIGQPNQLGGNALGGLQQGALGGLQLGGGGGLQVGGLALGGALGLQVGGALGLQLGGGGIANGQLGGLGSQLGGVSGLQSSAAYSSFLQVQQAKNLTDLIKQVIGSPKEWRGNLDPATGRPYDPMADGDQQPLEDLNDVGYYPPAQALVVKAQTRLHTHASDPLSYGAAVTAMGNVNPDHKVNVAAAGGDRSKDSKAPQLDSKAIWQDALAKGVDDPGLVIACADFLAQHGRWDHAAEFLKADLRQGIVVRPWVYKSLAIALRESQGDPNEIERAEMSAAELEPLDAQGYLEASRAMAGDKRWDRALAFCKEAASLEPNTPYAYNEALGYAEAAQDVQGMEWAAGGLLRQDWPVSNKELQSKARQKAERLAGKLDEQNRAKDAGDLLDKVSGQRQRDLVIKLSWQGEADLDLKVKEPTGSVCWVLNRQTIGGGSMTGDAQADPDTETYQAAEAFSGDYAVTVDRVWGRALSDKAQLTVIRHQGTKDETQELLTIDLTSGAAVKLKLTDGRRTETAYVPPPSATRPVDEAVASPSSRSGFLNRLRKLSEPEVTGASIGFHGSTVGMGTSVAAPMSVAPAAGDQVVSQSKLSSFIANTLEVTSQTVLSADRRSMRVSMTPVFNTATDATPIVDNAAIPGMPQR